MTVTLPIWDVETLNRISADAIAIVLRELAYQIDVESNRPYSLDNAALIKRALRRVEAKVHGSPVGQRAMKAPAREYQS